MEAGNEPNDGLGHWAAYKPMYLGAFGVATVLLLVWSGLTFIVYPADVAASDATAARGQFGDMFGFANALFSGLAFTALIFSLHMQRKELALQRAELALTRDEMRLARGEATKQAQALADQASSMVQQTSTMAQQTAMMAQQAGNELLAARISGAGILLQTHITAFNSPNLNQWLSVQGVNVYEAVKQNRTELNDLLRTAAVASTQKGAGEQTTSTGPMP